MLKLVIKSFKAHWDICPLCRINIDLKDLRETQVCTKPRSWCIWINPLSTTSCFLFVCFFFFRLWFPEIKHKKIPIVGKFCFVGRYYYCHSIKLLLFKQCPKPIENDACCTFKYCFNPKPHAVSLWNLPRLCPQLALMWPQTNFLVLRILKAMA